MTWSIWCRTILWIYLYRHQCMCMNMTILMYRFTTSFSASSIWPAVYANMRNRRAVYRLVLTALCIAASMYVVIGTTGYLSFGSDTAGNITLNYPSTDGALIMLRAILIITIMCVCPLLFYATRTSFEVIFIKKLPVTTSRRILLSLALMSIISLVAALLPKIEYVASYNGAVFGTMVVFIGPGLLAIKKMPLKNTVTLMELTSQEVAARENEQQNSAQNEQQSTAQNEQQNEQQNSAQNEHDQVVHVQAMAQRRPDVKSTCESLLHDRPQWSYRRHGYVLIVFGCISGIMGIVRATMKYV